MNPSSDLSPGPYAETYSAAEFNTLVRAAGWDLEFLQLAGGTRPYRVRFRRLSGLVCANIAIDAPIHQQGAAPAGTISLGLPAGRQSSLKTRSSEISSESLFSFNTALGVDAVTIAPYTAYTLSIAEDRLEELAEHFQETDFSLGSLRSRYVRTPALMDLTALRTQLNTIFNNASQTAADNAEQDPHAACLEAELVGAMLQAWCGSGRAASLRAQPRARVLRLALDYIEDRTDAPINIASLCAECGVGRRTLERVFREQFNLSPKRYINLRRLSGAREALLTGQLTNSVQTVAQHWGFGHLSKFAADYKAIYGELPSDTLRRSGDLLETQYQEAVLPPDWVGGRKTTP